MRLNIHVTSHPIIQHLSSITKQKNLQINIKKQILRQLGLLLSYETIRNWLQTYKLTIQVMHEKKNIILIDPKESYSIITNTTEDLSLIQELQYLLPKCNISFIPINVIISRDNSCINKAIKEIKPWTKIIIISYTIHLEYIIKLIDQLINQDIRLTQIRLSCINCNRDQLIKISHAHPSLNIYTTEIQNIK